MAIILTRLRNGRSARPDELVEYVSREMELFDDKHSDVSLRTLQRDISTIAELFHIEIACHPSRGYTIVERGDSADEYETLLLNFELNGADLPGAAAQHNFVSSGETQTESFSLLFQVTSVPSTLQVVASGGTFVYSTNTLNLVKLS